MYTQRAISTPVFPLALRKQEMKRISTGVEDQLPTFSDIEQVEQMANNFRNHSGETELPKEPSEDVELQTPQIKNEPTESPRPLKASSSALFVHTKDHARRKKRSSSIISKDGTPKRTKKKKRRGTSSRRRSKSNSEPDDRLEPQPKS